MGMRDGMNIEEVMRGVEMQSNHEKMMVCTLFLKFHFIILFSISIFYSLIYIVVVY